MLSKNVFHCNMIRLDDTYYLKRFCNQINGYYLLHICEMLDYDIFLWIFHFNVKKKLTVTKHPTWSNLMLKFCFFSGRFVYFIEQFIYYVITNYFSKGKILKNIVKTLTSNLSPIQKHVNTDMLLNWRFTSETQTRKNIEKFNGWNMKSFHSEMMNK